MARTSRWSKTAALAFCVTFSTFGFSGAGNAASVTFDYGLIANGESSFGSIDNPEVAGTSNKGEGNWDIVVPLFNGTPGDDKLVIDGIGVTATGFLGTTETDAFLDSKSGGRYGGLGVCSSPSCTTGSNVTGTNTGDDNVTGVNDGDMSNDESLKLVYDTEVTYEIDKFFFRDGKHYELGGTNSPGATLDINGYIVAVVDGVLDVSGLSATDLADFEASLTQTTMTVFKYTTSQFYLTSATVFASSQVVPIPVPASLPLLGGVLGLLGLIGWRRRRLTTH